MTVIGTTDTTSASGTPTQTRPFYAAGRLWTFYYSDGQYLYSSSTDDGATWSAGANTYAYVSNGWSFAAAFDGTRVHLAYGNGGYIYYLMGTPASDGDIDWVAGEDDLASGTSLQLHSIDIDSDGYVLVSYYKDGYVYVAKNSDKTTGGWTDAWAPKAINTSTGSYWSRVVALGTSWYCVYGVTGGYVQGRLWNGTTLATADTISSQALQYSFRFSATQYGGVLEVAWNCASGIYTRRRSAAGVWGSVLACAPGVEATPVPLIVAASPRTYCFYINGGSLYYKTSVGGASWSGATALATGTFPAPDIMAGSKGVENGKVRVQTATGSGTYSVEMFDVQVGTPPTASFTRTPASGQAPLAVATTDTSTGTPTSWDWNWGDGSAHSSTQNSSHTYTSAGTFTITLTASNSSGSTTATASVTVSAAPPPNASFTASATSGSEPLTVTFTDTSTGTPTSWSWDFDDGTTSTAQSPTHTFVAGTYDVVLTATNSGGYSTATSQIIVSAQPAPVAAFTYAPSSGTAPLTVTFTNTSTGGTPTSYLWDFKDGSTSDSEGPSHTFTLAGTFAVTLTVANTGGSDTATHNVVVSAPAGGMAATLDWRGPTSCSIHRCYGADKFLRPRGVTTIPYYDDLRTLAWSGTAPTVTVADATHPSFGYAYANGLAGRSFLLFQDRPGGNPADGCCEAMLRHVSSSAAANTAWVAFRLTDASNFYFARLNTDRTLEVRKVVGGTQTQIALVSVPSVNPAAIYRLRVKMNGASIAVFLNGTQYMALTDSSHGGGTCGVAFHYCQAEVYQLLWYDEDPETALMGWMPFMATAVEQSGEATTHATPTMANQGLIVSQAGTKNRKVQVSGTILSGTAPVDYVGTLRIQSARSCLEYLRSCGYIIYLRTPFVTAIGHLTDIEYPEPGPYVEKFSDFGLTVTELWG